MSCSVLMSCYGFACIDACLDIEARYPAASNIMPRRRSFASFKPARVDELGETCFQGDLNIQSSTAGEHRSRAR